MARSRVAAWRPGARTRRWGLRAFALLVLTVMAYLGGLSATSIWPTTVGTDHYQAQVRLSALPTLTSTLHSPTSFGDIDLEFRSVLPAPGIDATVQVKENITDVFDERHVSISSLRPSNQDVSAALTQAAQRVALKFALGAVLVSLGALALVVYGQRRGPSRVQLSVGGLAAVIAIAGTGAGIADSYQPSHLTAFRTTSLLGTVRRSAGLLTDVQQRAQQATPYIRNLLALSQALQEKFVPQAVDQPAAARFLLVSDLHGANQYAVMRGIIRDENITAVIDSGDLLTFGSVAEAEASGMFKAIAGLGVPYIFVRGNHDADSPTDQALLERMGQIKNVILLQPDPHDYTQATIDGISIAGFNDPRWFGDDNQNNSAKQQPAADAFNAAFAGRGTPDLVVSHEPGAVTKVKSARTLVNGHMHRDELDGNRIGVGTFTGGGTFTHYVQSGGSSGDQGELTGQPYAFDIAVFNQQCGLSSLVRYTYRNLVEGHPSYDDVTVINGRTIAGDPGKGRTCGAARGIQLTTVPATPPQQ